MYNIYIIFESTSQVRLSQSNVSSSPPPPPRYLNDVRHIGSLQDFARAESGTTVQGLGYLATKEGIQL